MKKIVLITGASSGIGRAITHYLASLNYVVYAGARKSHDLQELLEIENVIPVRLDVTKAEDIKMVVAQISREQGHLDCLINNAGLMGWGAIVDRDLDYFKQIFEVNVWGSFRITKACFELLKKSGNRPIVFNISSQGENYTLPFWAPYMMSKHALKAFTSTLRREFMLVGIRVVGIAPGAFKSNMLGSQLKALEEYEHKYSSEFTPWVIKMLGFPIREKTNRGKSPEVIGCLIHKLILKKRCKARYQPGRKFLPDVVLQKFPVRLVDMLIMKMLKK